MNRLRAFFARHTLKVPTWAHIIHHSHNLAHCTYLGAVWHEAHGMYGRAAGVLLVLTVLSFFVHEAGEVAE